MITGTRKANVSRFEYKGKMYTAAELAELSPTYITPKRIRDRIHDGWTVEDAVEKPLDKSRYGRRNKPIIAPEGFAGLDEPGSKRILALDTIAQTVIAGSLYAFEPRIIAPMFRYSFSGEDLLTYYVEFSSADNTCIATLTARYKQSGIRSTLNRKYKVHGALVEEVKTE